MSDRIVTPEFIQAVIGVLVILLVALVPQFEAEIKTIAAAVAAILIALFATQAGLKAIVYRTDVQLLIAQAQAKQKDN